MIVLTKLIGIAIAVFGLLIFLSPKFIEKIFAFFMEGKRIYIAGVIRIGAGFILLLTASKSLVPTAAIALGVMFLLSGIVVFSTSIESMKNFMTHYREMPQLVIRLLGLVAASFGVLIVSIF